MGCRKITYHEQEPLGENWKIFVDGLEKSASGSKICKDYYAGGSLMPGRNGNSNEYRYGGAGGQEKDDEITGVTGSHYTAKYWEYDSRLMRRWNTDPVTYFWQSPYATFNNNPIVFIDPEGLFGTRREARKFARKNKSQFKGGAKIGRVGKGEYVLQRKRDGGQFVYGASTAGYEFRKSRNWRQRNGDYLRNPDNFSFGRDKPLNVFGVNVFRADRDVEAPFSKVTISAYAEHTSNGIKNKFEIGSSSTCETCQDNFAKTSTSFVLGSGTKLKNPSASDIAAGINLTFKLGLNLPATNKSSISLGGSYGPWSASYTPSTKDLTFGFTLGTKDKGIKGKIELETKIQENTIFEQ